MVTLTSAPDTERHRALSDAIVKTLAALPYVHQIYLLGSLARDEADRFSDIDLLAITQTRPQFRAAFDALRSVHATIYHAPFTPDDSTGGHALGCIFEGESIFHSLDLYFMTTGEQRAYQALDRFGDTRSVYERDGFETTITGELTVTGDPTSDDEQTILAAMQPVREAIKARLRGDQNHAVLRQHATRLYMTMQAFPADMRTANGEIGRIAKTYVKIVRKLLKADS